MENIEEKFKKIMEREGLEKLTEPTEEQRFQELMKKQDLEKLTKPLRYVVRFRDSDFLGGGSALVEVFSTKEERDKWYEEVGRESENLYGVKLEFTEEPVEDEAGK